ncbi:MAG: F0F1 ATP synthase subunit A [Bacteroidota bacterium]
MDSVLHAASDSAQASAPHGAEHGGGLFTELLHHVQDAHFLDVPFAGHVDLPRFPPLEAAGMSVDLSITKHVVFLWVGALVLAGVAIAAARSNIRRDVPRGLGNLLEIFVVFIRDEIAVANMGPGGVRYMPYLLTTFFYILVLNLLGLIPYGASATGNVSVTAGLALIAFVMIQAAAIRAQGLRHWLAHLTGGVHWSLWVIMVPIEILGLFTKPFALCIRLFANMTGGHIVIVSLIGLIFIFQSYIAGVISTGFVLGINFLELFVAFLQAYIFTMLTALFMGLGMQAGAESGHGEGGH